MAKIIIEISDLEDDFINSTIQFLDEDNKPLSPDTLATPAIRVASYIFYLIENGKLIELVSKELEEAGIIFND